MGNGKVDGHQGTSVITKVVVFVVVALTVKAL